MFAIPVLGKERWETGVQLQLHNKVKDSLSYMKPG